jgi:hypothetical protein
MDARWKQLMSVAVWILAAEVVCLLMALYLHA